MITRPKFSGKLGILVFTCAEYVVLVKIWFAKVLVGVLLLSILRNQGCGDVVAGRYAKRSVLMLTDERKPKSLEFMSYDQKYIEWCI
jgi:hypothetical protein